MRVAWILAVVALITPGTRCAAQNSTVRGFVFSASDSVPVFHAEVRFFPPNTTLRTDSLGYFEYRLLPGSKSVRVRRLCYISQTRTEELLAGTDQVLDTFWLETDQEVCQEDLWIVGQILAAEDSTPLAGAAVSIANEAYGFGGYDPVLQTESGWDGVFRLRVPEAGEKEFRIDAICRERWRMGLEVAGVLDLKTIWLERSYDTLRLSTGLVPCWRGGA